MKDLKTILLITFLLVAGARFDATAQNRNARTASARAAYGLPAEKNKPKAGKKKKTRQAKTKGINGKKRK